MKYLVMLIVGLLLAGCGKYGPPLAPELLRPAAVLNLRADADIHGVQLQWEAPEKDARGGELKQIDGYRVMRRRRGDEQSEEIQLAFIPDRHLLELRRLREEAYRAGQLTRKVQVDPQLKSFKHSDEQIDPGSTYFYRIIPVNYGDVEGVARQVVRVEFRGLNSSIAVLAAAEAE